MKFFKNPLTIGLMVVFALLAPACGPSKAELQVKHAQEQIAAMSRASTIYNQGFLSEKSGDKAAKQKASIESELGGVGLTPDILGIRESDMLQHIRTLYANEATALLVQLSRTHKNIKEAEKLADLCREKLKKANKSVSPNVERVLALDVARNKKEEGVATERAHGVRPPAAPAKKRPTRRLAQGRR